MGLHFRPLPILSLATIASACLLVWLGMWQWQRFEQKIAARDAVPERVAVETAPDTEKAVFVFGVLDGRQGWRVFAPAMVEGKAAFVDLAFWPGLEPPHNTFCFLREGVQGVWAIPKRATPFQAPDNPQARLFYHIALPEMAQRSGLRRIEARYLAADYGPRPNPFVRGSDPLPPERHLGYAVTWWGLALGLIGVYAAFHASRGRLSFAARRERGGDGPA